MSLLSLGCLGQSTAAYESPKNNLLKIQTFKAQLKEPTPIYFNQFFKADNIQNQDFNIKPITAISKLEPKTRPGLAPDWGTELFEGMVFENLTFEGCNFRYLNFSHARFVNVKFINCQFEGTIFDDAKLSQVNFEDCNLVDSSFNYSILNDVLFKHNNASYANFMQATLDQVTFNLNTLQGTSFLCAKVKHSSFSGDVQDVLFYGTEEFFNVKGSERNKPVILVSWNTKQPSLAASKIIKKIKEFNGIPLKYNFADAGINIEALKNNVDSLMKEIHAHDLLDESSIPKKLLSKAKQINAEHCVLAEINKIQGLAKLLVNASDGIIIPGGQDVQPMFYGELPDRRTVLTNDLRRDLFEFAIMDEADARELPVLGICRGLQLANIWRGGTLHQHVEGQLYVLQRYHLTKEAQSKVEPSVAKEIFCAYKKGLRGYSFHHQSAKQIGKDLTVMSTSKNGTVKALELLGKRFFVLVQWHPEYKGDVSTPGAAKLNTKLSKGNNEFFRQLIAAAAKS